MNVVGVTVKMKNILRLSTAGILLLSLSTLANDNHCDKNDNNVHYKHCDSQIGWYIGGQLGYAQTDISQSDIDTFYDETGFEANSIDIDDSGLAFSLMAGYQFNTNWAVEGAYIDLGERSVDFTGRTEDLDTFYDNVEHVYPQSGDGFSIAVVGSWAISEEIKLSGKLGYWHWEGDYTTYDANSNVGSDSINGNDLWFGAELNYRLNERTQIYLSAQRFNLERDDNDVLGLGIRYYFGEESQSREPTEKVKPTTIVKKDNTLDKVALVEVAAPKDTYVDEDKDKDGVLDIQDACANSNLLHLVDAKGCTVIKEQAFSFNLTIYYANDSTDIPSNYDDKLQALAEFINEYKVKQLNVYDHTSAPGSRSYNQRLSQKRAESVGKVLTEQFNIDGQIIVPIGKGETERLNKENTEDAHDVNRRIELSITEQLLLPVKK